MVVNEGDDAMTQGCSDTTTEWRRILGTTQSEQLPSDPGCC
jgi:hypothetical protein